MPITINGTTGISGVDGSAGTPAVIGSDADTGLFFSAGFLSGSVNGTAGRIPSLQLYRLNAGLAGSNVNTAQSVFGVGVTVAGSTVYAFEARYVLTKTAGTTSHSIRVLFGGTATVNNIGYVGIGRTGVGGFGTDGFGINTGNTAGETTVTGATATASVEANIVLNGTISINAGGTLIPQYVLTTAPGGAYTVGAGSYFAIYPLSASGANTSIGTWS